MGHTASEWRAYFKNSDPGKEGVCVLTHVSTEADTQFST